MATVITLSRNFLKGHPRAGEPTYFVEKFYAWYFWNKNNDWSYEDLLSTDKIYQTIKSMIRFVGDYDSVIADDFMKSIDMRIVMNPDMAKVHTIRARKRKVNQADMVSNRTWSGKPYNSKQIILAPDIEVAKVWDFKNIGDRYKIESIMYGAWIDKTMKPTIDIANNDGLNIEDFNAWFSKPFEGQIICWDKNVNYV